MNVDTINLFVLEKFKVKENMMHHVLHHPHESYQLLCTLFTGSDATKSEGGSR